METTAPAQTQEPTDRPRKPPKENAGCDPVVIDNLVCESKGVEKRSQVIAESLVILQDRQTKYDTAQHDYEVARTAADTVFEDGRKTLLARKKEVCRCLTQAERSCLERSMQKVRDEIIACSGPGGCPPLDYTFDSRLDRDGGHDTPATLTGRAHEYRTIAEELRLTFDDLLKETTELTARATKFADDVAALAADESDNLTKYAKILVLLFRYDDRFRGYPTAQSYVDCLCVVLSMLLRAWQAIAVLEAAAAERTCCAERQKNRCDALVADPVHAVIEHYKHDCVPKDPSDDGDGDDDDPHDDDDDDDDDDGKGGHGGGHDHSGCSSCGGSKAS